MILVQLIVAGREEPSSEITGFRNRGWAVHLLPADKLPAQLELGAVLFADAIVFFIDMNEHALASPPTFSVGIGGQETLMQQVRRLPHSCAMLDGRKWNGIPIIMVLAGIAAPYYREEFHRLAAEDSAVLVDAETEFQPTVNIIERAVRDYRQRLLADFSNLGCLVTLQHGRYRVGLALHPKEDLEGTLYYGLGDRRDWQGKYVTVDRDLYGIQVEVEQFEVLINHPETAEGTFQRFFEEHPHFLGDLQSSLPLSHVRLEHASGLYIPDFILKPIVAYQRDTNWRVLDLKRPNAPLLAGPANHVRLSHDVTQAIAQLRDYGDYFQNPENAQRIVDALGHRLKYPELAVLIGRLRDTDPELLNKAQSREPDVRIVTYDEILQHQQHLIT